MPFWERDLGWIVNEKRQFKDHYYMKGFIMYKYSYVIIFYGVRRKNMPQIRKFREIKDIFQRFLRFMSYKVLVVTKKNNEIEKNRKCVETLRIRIFVCHPLY